MVVSRTIDPEKKLGLEIKLKEAQEQFNKRQEILSKSPDHKTALKGAAAWTEKIQEIQKQILEIETIGDKIQITPAIYENALATVDAIKSHPHYDKFLFGLQTSQTILTTEKLWGQYKGKGKLDYLEVFYDEGTTKCTKAVIADVKTCRDLKKLELDNTHYKGQLAFYRELVHRVYDIPKDKIECYIIIGDKQTGKLKNAEIMLYDKELLDEMDPLLEAWTQKMFNACIHNLFMSAREAEGIKQQCFTCSSCRTAPFTKNSGEILTIDRALLQSIKSNNSLSPTVFVEEDPEY
jgi:hypothetical protein